MSDFSVPNEEQRKLMQDCGIDPSGYAVTTDNERTLSALHLKTRNEIMIIKNERMKLRGNQ